MHFYQPRCEFGSRCSQASDPKQSSRGDELLLADGHTQAGRQSKTANVLLPSTAQVCNDSSTGWMHFYIMRTSHTSTHRAFFACLGVLWKTLFSNFVYEINLFSFVVRLHIFLSFLNEEIAYLLYLRKISFYDILSTYSILFSFDNVVFISLLFLFSQNHQKIIEMHKTQNVIIRHFPENLAALSVAAEAQHQPSPETESWPEKSEK